MSKKQKFDPWEDGRVTPTELATLADTPAIVLEQPPAEPAESVKYDLSMSRKHSAYSAAYLARAGWTLAQSKVSIAHGGWEKWCRESVGISDDTADRYIKFYHATVGKWRESQGLANTIVAELTDKMIAAATRELDYKTGTQAMIELGIIKRPEKWGGEREGAGRKAAAAAAAAEDGLSDQDSATVMWINAMAPFERDRAAFHSAARDLRPEVARRFLSELEMLEGALKEHLKEF